ncbi:TatD family hydrolase [Rurimicrobium arvi]|uniref:TatD family hydrolase n=1 Tax=Rurimicrobium arvi TaxID=2049916 RepID=A0ABP8MH94_9BACT
MFIDTHTHLYDEETIEAQDAHIRRALAAGVNKMYMPNCDSGTVEGMLDIAARFPGNCFPMAGLHPCYVKENFREELARVKQELETRPYVAVGEVGLDFYWDRTHAQEQKVTFEQQIDWAMELGLPVIIHSRSSTKECSDIVARKQNGSLVTVFHCYSGTVEEALRICDMGGYLGIGGVVTFKKSILPDVLRAVPISSIVLETDAPYLAPVPYRGKRNESTYIPLIAEKVAELYEMSLADVARITSENAEKIFGNTKMDSLHLQPS